MSHSGGWASAMGMAMALELQVGVVPGTQLCPTPRGLSLATLTTTTLTRLPPAPTTTRELPDMAQLSKVPVAPTPQTHLAVCIILRTIHLTSRRRRHPTAMCRLQAHLPPISPAQAQ